MPFPLPLLGRMMFFIPAQVLHRDIGIFTGYFSCIGTPGLGWHIINELHSGVHYLGFAAQIKKNIDFLSCFLSVGNIYTAVD